MSAHTPRKRFGQHFLHDPQIIRRIIAAFAPRPGDTVVEIGPGPGTLTRELVGKVAALHAVELDRDLVAALRAGFAPGALTIHDADALAFDFCALAPGTDRLRVIGNLPYNISTPLLFHLLDQIACIDDMLFMLQREVVQRMAAAPGSADYGRLSVMVQWRCRVEMLFAVGAGAFRPPPKVQSAVVRLRPHGTPPVAVHAPEVFAHIVRLAFSHRRKTLRNALKGVLDGERIQALGIDPGRRPETLGLEEFAALGNAAAEPAPASAR